MPKVTCAICGESKVREAKFNEKGGRYYIEPSTSLRWKGKNCPECLNFKDEVTVKLTTRKCRGCQQFLTSDRYFNCLQCQPVLPSIDDDFIYEADSLDDYTVQIAEDLFSADDGGGYEDSEDYEVEE